MAKKDEKKETSAEAPETSAEAPETSAEAPETSAAETKKEDDAPVRDITKYWTKKAMKMKKELEKQPKVNFLIPLAPGEKEGAYETVQLNGYRFVIKKGVLVELPQQVVEVLAEHYKVSIEAGKEKLITRDKETLEALT